MAHFEKTSNGFQCNKSSQFTCHNGICIDLNERCNGIADCIDGTDEENCDILSFDDKSYKSYYPPGIDTENSNETLPINVTFLIYAIEQLMEIEMRFKTKLTLALEWKDNRLTYYNLKDDVNSNLVGMTHRSSLWIPPLIFNNTEDNIKVVNSEQALMFIRKQGKSTPSGIAEVDENFVYKGGENYLIFQNLYVIEQGCTFLLANYPFDTQKCRIEVGFSLN